MAENKKKFDFEKEFIKKANVEVSVDEVRIRGNVRTKSHIILKAIEPAVSSGTLNGITQKLVECTEALRAFEVFDGVDLFLDKASKSDGACIVVTVREKPDRPRIETGSYVQQGEGTMEASYSLRNRFGRAEKFEINAAVGTKISNAFKLNYSMPYLFGYNNTVNVETFKSINNFFGHSAHSEKLRGISADIGGNFFGMRHNIGTEAVWREITNIVAPASTSIYREAGHSMKTSVKHAMEADTRDDTLIPTRGHFFRLSSEFAGVGGTTSFLKNEVQTQLNIPLFYGVSMAFAACGGALVGLEDRLHIHDKFFLGGPRSLRGFRTKGVGPRDGRDSIGGNLYATGSAALSFPIPHDFFRNMGVRGHLYANGGSLVQVSKQDMQDATAFKTLAAAPRLAVGAGLVFPSQLGRVELNYSVALKHTKNDRPKNLQLGVGISII